MTSIIIPFRNDNKYIDDVISRLIAFAPIGGIEIIVVNDGSTNSFGKFSPLKLDYAHTRVINNTVPFGVGYSFDRGVGQARGDILILMGADVFVKEDYYEKVRNAVLRNPDTLGCGVCIGLNPTRLDIHSPKCFRRYGADLLFKVTVDDLPETSEFKHKKDFRSIFRGKWTSGKKGDEPYDLPCLMGAFYFTSKSYYDKLGGWDTKPGMRDYGHQSWGALEPFISLKSWLVGGGCTLYSDIEAGHVFGKTSRKDKWKRGKRGVDDEWFNRLWILETMIMDEGYRQELYNFVNPDNCFNLAHKRIKERKDLILEKRAENTLKFKNTLKVFEDKFGYKFD